MSASKKATTNSKVIPDRDVWGGEENFHSMFAKHHAVMLIIEPDSGNIVDANAAAEQFYGYPIDRLRAMKITDINTLPPDEVAQERLLALHEKRNYFIFPHRLASEETRIVEVDSSPITLNHKPLLFSIIHDITERKRAENELRESEERFRTILDNIEDGYYEVDLNGRLTFVNRAYIKMLGYDENELIGMDYHQYMSPETAKVVFQTFNRVYSSGVPEQAFDWGWICKGGMHRSIEISVSPIKSADGRIMGFRGIVRDISERKRAENLTRRSEERYQIVADFAYDWELWILPDGSLAYVSPSCERITGYPAQAFIEDPSLQLKIVHPEDQAQYADHLEKVNIHPAHQSLDYRIIHRDGHIIWISHTCSAVSGTDGRPLGRRVSNRDITDRKRAEEKLATSEAELRTLFASMHDVALVIDREGVYRKIAPTNPGLLVKPAEELLGKNLTDVFPPEQANTFRDVMQKVLGTKQNSQIEYELNIAGRTVWFQTTVSPLNADSTLWVAHDITSRKQAEEKLRRAKDELETVHRELQQSFAREQQMARTDELTDINNHHFLLQLADREFDVAMRYHLPLTMMFFDIDDFKQINDAFGHLMGDQALKKLIQIIRAEIRSADVIGRYGGDEFVILLPQTSAQEALPFAERIHASIAAMRLDTDKGALTLTISIGIAQMIHGASQIDTLENLLLRADQALYAAKQAGKNCTVIDE